MDFPKGKSPNPVGRPKGSNKRYSIDELRNAIKKVEKVKGTTLLLHYIEKAFSDEKVLVSVMRKLLPDLRHVNVEGLPEPGAWGIMTPAEIAIAMDKKTTGKKPKAKGK